jgi:hypothetical protein
MRSAAILAIVSVLSCTATPEDHEVRAGAGPPDAASYGEEVERAYEVVRAATAAFHNLDSAVAAGYAGEVAQCFTDSLHTPSHGGMGYHHVNRRYLDGTLDVDKPEILLYERESDGGYALNGVEYILPYRFWPRDSTPPMLMGRALFREDTRNYWYTHMWVWTENPAGLFADWNPGVGCPGPP